MWSRFTTPTQPTINTDASVTRHNTTTGTTRNTEIHMNAKNTIPNLSRGSNRFFQARRNFSIKLTSHTHRHGKRRTQTRNKRNPQTRPRTEIRTQADSCRQQHPHIHIEKATQKRHTCKYTHSFGMRSSNLVCNRRAKMRHPTTPICPSPLMKRGKCDSYVLYTGVHVIQVHGPPSLPLGEGCGPGTWDSLNLLFNLRVAPTKPRPSLN